MSIRMRSGRSDAASSRASGPSPAMTTSYSSSASRRRTSSAMAGSSSTVKILGIDGLRHGPHGRTLPPDDVADLAEQVVAAVGALLDHLAHHPLEPPAV